MLPGFFIPKEREWLTPVTLTRKEPVAEFELDLLLTLPVFKEPVDNLLFSVFSFKAIKKTRINGRPRIRTTLPILITRWLNHLKNGKPKFLSEFKIASVMRWHRHNGSAAVSHHDIVSDPDRNLFAIHRIDRKSSSIDSCLFLIKSTLHIRLAGTCRDVCFNSFFLRS